MWRRWSKSLIHGLLKNSTLSSGLTGRIVERAANVQLDRDEAAHGLLRRCGSGSPFEEMVDATIYAVDLADA
jgi:hypothetical protein